MVDIRVRRVLEARLSVIIIVAVVGLRKVRPSVIAKFSGWGPSVYGREQVLCSRTDNIRKEKSPSYLREFQLW